jgi:hypothetical protein
MVQDEYEMHQVPSRYYACGAIQAKGVLLLLHTPGAPDKPERTIKWNWVREYEYRAVSRRFQEIRLLESGVGLIKEASPVFEKVNIEILCGRLWGNEDPYSWCPAHGKNMGMHLRFPERSRPS